MSTASIQNLVSPPVAQMKAQNFSAMKNDDANANSAQNQSNKTDFRTLITNSMDEIQKERKAKENGDLTASSDAEFLEKLADQTKDKRVPKNELGKDDFLKLFVTQLQNQNPLNPEADTEMAAKLAQFNGLEQMLNVNKSLEKLIADQNQGKNLQLVNYVGREVVIDGGGSKITQGKMSPTEFTLEAAAGNTTLEVRNSSGIVVAVKDLGPQDAGVHQINWDGKNKEGKTLPDGTYTLALSARNIDGKPVPVKMSSKVRVTGIDINSNDGSLYSEFGRIKLDQIRSVGIKGFDHQAESIAEPIGSQPDLKDIELEEKMSSMPTPNSNKRADVGIQVPSIKPESPKSNTMQPISQQSPDNKKFVSAQ